MSSESLDRAIETIPTAKPFLINGDSDNEAAEKLRADRIAYAAEIVWYGKLDKRVRTIVDRRSSIGTVNEMINRKGVPL